MSSLKKELLLELENLLVGYWLTDLSNFSALFFDRYPEINWIGFYLTDGKKLRLGPFAGRPACTDIGFDRGVCGASFSSGKSLIVNDVHQFPGHIACDPKSRSELVIPLTYKEKLIGVLDIDSPKLSRFEKSDLDFFEQAVACLMQKNQDIQYPELSI